MAVVLLTGFAPFAGTATNPSAMAVAEFAAQHTRPHQPITDVLPVIFDESATRMSSFIEQHHPDVVVAVGLAGRFHPCAVVGSNRARG